MENICLDYDICTKCGGRCCKKSGCTYLPEDFDRLTYNYLLELLKEEPVSIISQIYIDADKNNKFFWYPVLMMSVKNNDRGTVDLFSYKSGCSIWNSLNGCPLTEDKRPSLALSYKPDINGNCTQVIKEKVIIKKWLKYQDVLEKLVMSICNKSAKEIIKEDIEKVRDELTKKIISGKFLDAEELSLLDTIKLYDKTSYSKDVKVISNGNTKKKKRK